MTARNNIKRRIHLSSRLRIIASLVEKCNYVADIGADHGRLIIDLVKNNTAKWGMAVENKSGPYKTLVKAVETSGLQTRIRVLFADGISKIIEPCKTVVIAGMGTNNIISILTKYPKKLDCIQTLIIDSHTSTYQLRREVTKLGFYIDEEKAIVEDGIYYEVIRFKRGKKDYTEDELQYGPILSKNMNVVTQSHLITRLYSIHSLLELDNIGDDKKATLEEEAKAIERVLNYDKNKNVINEVGKVFSKKNSR